MTYMPRLGEVLGAWRLTHLAGEGTTAWVFAAENADGRRRAAIKVLRPELGPERIAGLQAEAQLLATVKSDHVVERLTAGEQDVRWTWYAMEHLQGRPLSDLGAWENVGSAPRATAIAGQLAAALTALHRVEVVHGDVRPENVLLVHRRGTRDWVKLIDFGSATRGGEPMRRTVTRASELRGVPSYMSPEQLSGRPYDAQTDVWSLGVVLYELVTGELPFTADTFDALVVAVLTAPVPSPSARAAFVVPRGLEEVIVACLEREPRARPSARDIARTLAA
jgi:eukaryotic-like serine/threonine-protein kinase